MSKLKSVLTLVSLALLVGLLTASCGKDKEDEKKELTPVSFQLSWIHEYSSAPFYFAVKNNRFFDEGLTVSILEGGFQDNQFINSIQVVADGQAQFGTTDLGGLLQARAEGQPVVAIATGTQLSPFALLSLPDAGITKPEDLAGKTVAVTDGGSMLLYQAMLAAADIDPETVNTIPRTSFGIEPLLNGEVDALGGWIINEGQLIREAGYEPNAILFSSYGIESYDFLVFTTEDMIANQPDTVTSFVKAFRQGLQDALDDPNHGAELAVEYNSALDLEGQKARMQIYVPLIKLASQDLGQFDPDVFDYYYELLLDGEMLTAPFDVTTAYTLEFLE